MNVMKLSTTAVLFATKTVLVNGLKQSSSALACPPVWMVCLMLPLKSNTLTLLDSLMVPMQGGSWIGASPTHISFPMITSPFGPDWPAAAGVGPVVGQLPANCPTASSVACLVVVLMVTTP